MNVAEALKVYQPVDLVPRCEFAFDTLLVLEDALFEIPSHAGVKCFRPIRHYVNVVKVGRAVHRSFVGGPSLREGPHFLRMTAGWGLCL